MSMTPIEFGGKEWGGGTILVHGIQNTGKTVLLAAALKYFSQFGKVTLASMSEEQGHDSAAGMGLEREVLGYQCLYNIDNYSDMIEWLAMIEKGDYIATGVDSLWAVYRAIQKKTTKGERPPKAGKNDTNEWPFIHNDAHNFMTRWRKASKWGIMTCPSDTGQNVIKEAETAGLVKDVKVTPDLNGKMAEGCVAWFNLVGYLMCDMVKQGKDTKLMRTLALTPSKHYVTRQRMPYQAMIEKDIVIPHGNAEKGWADLMALANKAYLDAYNKAHKGNKKNV